MSLVTSMLQSIVRVNGEALVLHAGDKPYIVAPSGKIEIASRGLTLEAVSGIVAQLLPIEFQNALDEFGAAQYELPRSNEFPGEHFTVVAARGDDDVWAEVRRHRIPDDDLVPEDLFDVPGAETPGPVVGAVQQRPGGDDLALPDATRFWGHSERAEERPLSPLRSDTPPALASHASGLDRLLRIAAARTASTLYLSSDARPSVRVGGEVQTLDGEPSFGPNEVESLLLTLMPERNHEELRTGVPTEWISDLEGVGRVLCVSFRDHRGPAGVFWMMSGRAVSS